MTRTSRTRARIYDGTQRTIVYNHDDAAVERLAEAADVVEGCRAVGFTLGVPQRSMMGVVDGVLVDRAFGVERATHALELVATDDLRSDAPHFVADTLAAAALARSYGVGIDAVRQTAADFVVADHRGETVAVVIRRALHRQLQGHERARGRRRLVGRDPRWSGSPVVWPRAEHSTTCSASIEPGSARWS